MTNTIARQAAAAVMANLRERGEFCQILAAQKSSHPAWVPPEVQAAAIAKRAETEEKNAKAVLAAGPVDVFSISPDDIELARYSAFAGRKHEALIYLERALGREFHGRLA